MVKSLFSNKSKFNWRTLIKIGLDLNTIKTQRHSKSLDIKTPLYSSSTFVSSHLWDFNISCFLFEKKISKYIRKWLNINSSAIDLTLYSPVSPCPWPIKSRTSILKSSKISGHLLVRGSKDPLVSTVPPNLKSGHWKATSALQITEAEPHFCKIRGPLHLGRSNFGMLS